MVFYHIGGVGSVRVVKDHTAFLREHVESILGTPKKVLHLVWSAFVISAAFRTALKVARGAQILKKEGQY